MKQWIIGALAGCTVLAAQADTITVTMKEATATGLGQDVGTVTIESTAKGLVFRPALSGLAAGMHGFHIHANASCDPAEKDGATVPAGAAGGHWDPANTGAHGEPWADGHKGDLPALTVVADGTANLPVLAPRLDSLDEVRGHALMIHQGSDNYSDHPHPLGGGGARFACGLIQ